MPWHMPRHLYLHLYLLRNNGSKYMQEAIRLQELIRQLKGNPSLYKLRHPKTELEYFLPKNCLKELLCIQEKRHDCSGNGERICRSPYLRMSVKKRERGCGGISLSGWNHSNLYLLSYCDL